MDWDKMPDEETIGKVVAGMRGRNFNPVVVADRGAALEKLRGMIPEGSDVMTGASTTLEEIGFTMLLTGHARSWKDWKDRIFAEKDPQMQMNLRRQSTTASYFIGSIQALTEEGQALGADATGSRQGGYVYGARKVIWVVGLNKVVRDMDMAFRRLNEHCVPKEDARMKSRGERGTYVGKVVIYEREGAPDRIATIMVREKLGF